MTPETPIRFLAGDIELDGRISIPASATRACVVCHPHPLYGGDMHNGIVRAVVDTLRAAGVATLRFDFRGTGRSGGRHSGGSGEVADTRAAVEELASRSGLPRVTVAGYSFGALVALHAAVGDERIQRVVAIAPPLAMAGAAFATALSTPVTLVSGDRDEYCPASALDTLAASLPDARAVLLCGADHFLGGRETEVADLVAGALA